MKLPLDLTEFTDPTLHSDPEAVVNQIAMKIRDWEWAHLNLCYEEIDVHKWVHRSRRHARNLYHQILADAGDRGEYTLHVNLSVTRSDLLLEVGADSQKEKTASQPPLKSETEIVDELKRISSQLETIINLLK